MCCWNRDSAEVLSGRLCHSALAGVVAHPTRKEIVHMHKASAYILSGCYIMLQLCMDIPHAFPVAMYVVIQYPCFGWHKLPDRMLMCFRMIKK